MSNSEDSLRKKFWGKFAENLATWIPISFVIVCAIAILLLRGFRPILPQGIKIPVGRNDIVFEKPTPTPTTKPADTPTATTPQPPAPAIPPTPTPTPTVPPPRGVSFYREGDDAPFLTETGELCKVLRENMDKVEIPEWYFARLDLPEGSIVRVENAETGQQRDLQVVIRHDVRDCVIGFGQDNRTLLGLPEDLGELGDPRRYGHSIKITLYSP